MQTLALIWLKAGLWLQNIGYDMENAALKRMPASFIVRWAETAWVERAASWQRTADLVKREMKGVADGR